MKKEKTFKTIHKACEYLKEGEYVTYDKHKKAYVNIKDFPHFKDPFIYQEWKGVACGVLAFMVFITFGLYSGFLAAIVAYGGHRIITYERLL